MLGRDGGRAKFLARLGSEASDVLDEFLSFALEHETSTISGLQAFLTTLESRSPEIKRELEQGRDEVRIMTVHASKGLEAPFVFLVDSGGKPAESQHVPRLRELPIEKTVGPLPPALVWVPGKAIANSTSERLKAGISPDIVYDTRTNGAGSMMRIYRDVRFSRDKTPYKTNIAFAWWEGPRKKMENPSFGFQFGTHGAGLYGGVWGFPKEMMETYRQAVIDDKTFLVLSEITLALVLFLLGYAWHGFGAGLVATAWQDLIARCFPVERRGRFFGLTLFIGAAAGAAAAALPAFDFHVAVSGGL